MNRWMGTLLATLILGIAIHTACGQESKARGKARPSRVEPGADWAPPTVKDDGEKKILAVIDDLFKNQRRGFLNVPPSDGRLLRVLAEGVNAKHIVEIGASNGYSGLWWTLALRKTGGKLTTHELDPSAPSWPGKTTARALPNS